MGFQPTRNRSILILKRIQREQRHPLNRVSMFSRSSSRQMSERIGELMSEDETKIGFQGNQELR